MFSQNAQNRIKRLHNKLSDLLDRAETMVSNSITSGTDMRNQIQLSQKELCNLQNQLIALAEVNQAVKEDRVILERLSLSRL